MEMVRVGRSGEIARKVYEVGVEGRWEDIGLYDKGRRQKGENEAGTRLGSRAVRYKKKLEKGEVVNGRANAGRRLRRKGKIASRDGRNKKVLL